MGNARHLLAACLLGSLAILAGGCVTQPQPAAQPVASVAASRYFELAGRLSIRVEQRIDVVNIRWQRLESHEDIQLLSPLGSTVARLAQRTGEEALLDEGKGPVRRAASIEDLIGDVLGQPVPLQALAWWLQGWQAGGAAVLPAGDFRHDTWAVTVEKGADGRVIRLEAVQGDLRLRMVVDRFEVRG